MSQNRAKMSAHSRAALDAADTLRRVIGGMNDTPFMQETTSDRTARAHRMVEDSPDALAALEQGLTRSYAERIARVEDK